MTDKPAVKEPLAAPKGPQKGRSPAYPGVDLKRALELTRTLYKEARQHPSAPETVAQHWKMKAKSSQFLTSISAVKKFGLLEALPQRSSQSGYVKVSELALNIILDEREASTERDAAIRHAALNPEIHSELWRKYNGELPSDADLRFHLVRERKFTEAGAKEFIGEFRRTIAFAGLGSSDVLSDPQDDKIGGEKGAQIDRMDNILDGLGYKLPPPGRGPVREIPIPIQGAAWPALKAAFPLTEEAWTQMIVVLNAMKPGLVEAKPAEPDPPKAPRRAIDLSGKLDGS